MDSSLNSTGAVLRKPSLTQRYLLVVPIAFARDAHGTVWLDELWWHDLHAHLDYLDDVTVLAPCRRVDVPETGMVAAVAPQGKKLTFVDLCPAGGMRVMLRHLPTAIRTAWKAVGRSDLVHSGVAGWPIPPGMIVNPMARIRKKPLIIVIESAFWRLQPGVTVSRKARLRAWQNERFARKTARNAALAIYTHAGYRDSLPVGTKGTGIVLPASWISERDVLSLEKAEQAWDAKPHKPRFLLASRLVAEKGIPLFLNAMQKLEQTGVEIDVDVIGAGDLREEILAFSRHARNVNLTLLDPVPYGEPFLQLLQRYHASIVPLSGDEQARILYDSFARAVPVIASNTPGSREVVDNGETAFLFSAGDAAALADVLQTQNENPTALRRMGISALQIASQYTHARMHSQRADVLRGLFGTKRGGDHGV